MARGKCNGAVSPLPRQSVDGFFYFNDLIIIIIIKNEWFDRRERNNMGSSLLDGARIFITSLF